jgi:hypothetical protein
MRAPFWGRPPTPVTTAEQEATLRQLASDIAAHWPLDDVITLEFNGKRHATYLVVSRGGDDAEGARARLMLVRIAEGEPDDNTSVVSNAPPAGLPRLPELASRKVMGEFSRESRALVRALASRVTRQRRDMAKSVRLLERHTRTRAALQRRVAKTADRLSDMLSFGDQVTVKGITFEIAQLEGYGCQVLVMDGLRVLNQIDGRPPVMRIQRFGRSEIDEVFPPDAGELLIASQTLGPAAQAFTRLVAQQNAAMRKTELG